MSEEINSSRIAGETSAARPSGAAPEADAFGAVKLLDVLDELREHLAPVFEEQRATWEREGPTAMAAFEATGATLDQIGGNCPLQAEGSVDGQRFYFRARGDGWQFHVAPTDEQIFSDDAFLIDRDYGEWPDAGWMPNHEALGFIVQGIGEFRASVAQ